MSTASGLAIQPAESGCVAFIDWSRKRGVTINNVIPTRISGRGFGVIAQCQIEAGEELVSVPATALLTEESISNEFKENHGDLTVHGLLASFLAFGGAETTIYAPWQATWPSMTDFRECMPILWLEKLRASLNIQGNAQGDGLSILPPALRTSDWTHDSSAGCGDRVSKGLLNEQEGKFRRDWSKVKKTFPKADRETYLYYWLIVNTRSFYFELAGLKAPKLKEDHMALCPFVDFFNHADRGCNVTFDKDGYTVTADRTYATGEEIFVSYGPHSNDFLLVEYGFILESNRWDFLALDDYLMPEIRHNSAQWQRLENTGYLGNYSLTAEGVCFRTQVAVRAVTLEYEDWTKFSNGQPLHEDVRDRHDANADLYIEEQIMRGFMNAIDEALEVLTNLQTVDMQSQKEVLVKRWTQIRGIIRQSMENDHY